MLKKIIVPAISLAGVALSGCATQQATSYPNFTPTAIGQSTSTAQFKQKAETLFVVLDASSSKNTQYDGDTSGNSKFDVQKQFLNRMNKTIPTNIKLSSGLRNFGFGPCLNWGNTDLLQEVGKHSSNKFQSGLDRAQCASGGSPMESALAATATDIATAPGNIALLVVSDGHQLSPAVLTEAKTLENKFGDRLCIYSVWVGNKNEQAGQFLLQELSNIAGCGQSVNVSDVSTSPAIASFVEEMIFDKTKRAAPAPKAISLPLDSDGDGVIDAKDKCPNTPKGAKVNASGCWAFSNLKFNNNKATIKAGYKALFDNAIHVLKVNPSITVEIQGHTDSRGSAKYNQNLSARRAQAVKDHLVNNGINANRMTVKGFGEATPVATNDTAAGREENRRVEFTITNR